MCEAIIVITTTPAKAGGTDARLNGGYVAKLHQGDENRDHKDVDHGPAPDALDDAVEPGAVARAPMPVHFQPQDQISETQKLQHWHRDAGEENQNRQRPHVGGDEGAHTAHNGVGLAVAEGDHRHHREEIGRNVEDGRREHQSETAGQAVGLAEVEGGTAAWAAVMPLFNEVQVVAGMADHVIAFAGPKRRRPRAAGRPQGVPDLARFDDRIAGR